MRVELSCTCGGVAGTVDLPERPHRLVCFCTDCQAFLRHLAGPVPVGGAAILQCAPDALHLTHTEALAALTLTPRSPLIRWYCRSCRTPVANSLRSPWLRFAGLSEALFEAGTLDDYTPYAVNGAPPPGSSLSIGGVRVVARSFGMLARSSLRRADSPFFGADGTLLMEPTPLTPAQHSAAYASFP